MGEITNIAWCDHTFNPWIGCTKVSDGCVNCYAERDNKRRKWVDEWGVSYRLTSPANYLLPKKWAKKAVQDNKVKRIFCASLADVFDAKVPVYWRDKLWSLIKETNQIGGLEWLILTKRPENILQGLPPYIEEIANCIRIGVTAETQEMANIRIPILLDVWKGKNFVSVEPMLTRVSLWKWLPDSPTETLDWVICGCESGPKARPTELLWVADLDTQCLKSGTPFFLKQLNIRGRLMKNPFSRRLEFPKQEKEKENE